MQFGGIDDLCKLGKKYLIALTCKLRTSFYTKFSVVSKLSQKQSGFLAHPSCIYTSDDLTLLSWMLRCCRTFVESESRLLPARSTLSNECRTSVNRQLTWGTWCSSDVISLWRSKRSDAVISDIHFPQAFIVLKSSINLRVRLSVHPFCSFHQWTITRKLERQPSSQQA